MMFVLICFSIYIFLLFTQIFFYEEELYYKLMEINEDLPEKAINEAIRKIKELGIGSLVDKNLKFSNYLQTVVSVTYNQG